VQKGLDTMEFVSYFLGDGADVLEVFHWDAKVEILDVKAWSACALLSIRNGAVDV
jgi:hypothetical protein